jgi:AbrB family looped-hinge helix DNA binding protein
MSVATVTSKGQITLPAEIRQVWRIVPGDKVEFYRDHKGNLCIRRFNAGPLDFLKSVQCKAPLPGMVSDEAAIAQVMLEHEGRAPTKLVVRA